MMGAVTAVTAVTAGVAGLVRVERSLRRRRPSTVHGRYADWAHPRRALAPPAGLVANSRLLRVWCESLPVPAMASAITNVVYVNYLAPAGDLAPLVPPGLEIQRVGPGQEWAVLSFLTYRHGHLGPARIKRFRGLLPSPVQSNWRLYVREPRTGLSGVYFVSTAVDQTAYALGGRLLCEGLPMHLLRRASVGGLEGTSVSLNLDPGRGSGPDAVGLLRPAPEPQDGPWRQAFPTYADMLAHVVPQDRALSVQPWRRGVIRQEITIGLTPQDCVPLVGKIGSRYARTLVGDAKHFSFYVPRVDFRFAGESRL